MLPLGIVNTNNDIICILLNLHTFGLSSHQPVLLSISVCSRNQEHILFTTYHRLVYFRCSDIIVDAQACASHGMIWSQQRFAFSIPSVATPLGSFVLRLMQQTNKQNAIHVLKFKHKLAVVMLVFPSVRRTRFGRSVNEEVSISLDIYTYEEVCRRDTTVPKGHALWD